MFLMLGSQGKKWEIHYIFLRLSSRRWSLVFANGDTQPEGQSPESPTLKRSHRQRSVQPRAVFGDLRCISSPSQFFQEVFCHGSISKNWRVAIVTNTAGLKNSWHLRCCRDPCIRTHESVREAVCYEERDFGFQRPRKLPDAVWHRAVLFPAVCYAIVDSHEMPFFSPSRR